MNDFTKREIEVMKFLCLPNKEIGEKLFISPKTVQTHITNIRQKNRGDIKTKYNY